VNYGAPCCLETTRTLAHATQRQQSRTDYEPHQASRCSSIRAAWNPARLVCTGDARLAASQASEWNTVPAATSLAQSKNDRCDHHHGERALRLLHSRETEPRDSSTKRSPRNDAARTISSVGHRLTRCVGIAYHVEHSSTRMLRNHYTPLPPSDSNPASEKYEKKLRNS